MINQPNELQQQPTTTPNLPTQGQTKQDEKEQKQPMPPKPPKKKVWKILLFLLLGIIVALVLGLIITYAVLYFRGKNNALTKKEDVNVSVPNEVQEDVSIDDDGTVSYGGLKYTYNENITNILFIGVDRNEIGDTKEEIGINGQADALYLLSMDTQTGEKIITGISRDSMVDVNEYSVSGMYLGTQKEQICLSYAFGDGKESSCENTVKSASRLLLGIPIQSYVAIDLDATVTLTDLIDGVEVPEYDANYLPTGNTVTLYGSTVNNYIRRRDTSVLDSNNNRRARQLSYIKAFASKTIQKTKDDLSFPLSLYNAILPNMVTNVDTSRITYFATTAIQGGDVQYQSIAGEVVMGEEYAEFNVDSQQLYQMILSTFYTKK